VITSGAGKSTLVRMINLLERPDSGSVTVDGVELTKLSDEELRRQRTRIGMIFQHSHLLNNLTAPRTWSWHSAWRACRGPSGPRRVAESLAVVDLTDKAEAYLSKLSSGQKQRVAIARALANSPTVLLCDEPTSAVDPRTTITVLRYLREVNQRLGITIVLVTPEMNVVRAIADDVAVMEDGRIAHHTRAAATPPAAAAVGSSSARISGHSPDRSGPCSPAPGAPHPRPVRAKPRRSRRSRRPAPRRPPRPCRPRAP
jgi:D-methionine transport system ATP-binding protein